MRLVAAFSLRWLGIEPGRSCGICGGQSGSEAWFLRVLRFPLPVIPPIAPHLSSSIILLLGLVTNSMVCSASELYRPDDRPPLFG
jgi:hypothetical protein